MSGDYKRTLLYVKQILSTEDEVRVESVPRRKSYEERIYLPRTYSNKATETIAPYAKIIKISLIFS